MSNPVCFALGFVTGAFTVTIVVLVAELLQFTEVLSFI